MTPYIPDKKPLPEALSRTSHLGIGAHQDDLEFMAFHGIVQCYQDPEKWFTGITCTDGGGSPRSGPYAGWSDEKMKAQRVAEQIEAANLGEYSAQYQLGFSSAEIKANGRARLVKQLETILKETRPHTVYTHNPVDKHPTHLAVFAATLEALRSLPENEQPTTFLGCEVWRDLDWVADSQKVALDVSAEPELAARLNEVFQSQIAGGKNYHQAVTGRRAAHATFSRFNATDDAKQVIFALNLVPLLQQPDLSPQEFVERHLEKFAQEAREALDSLS